MLVCLYGLHAESNFLDQRILFSNTTKAAFGQLQLKHEKEQKVLEIALQQFVRRVDY